MVSSEGYHCPTILIGPATEMPQVLCQGFQALPFPQFPRKVFIDFSQKSEVECQIRSFIPWGPRSGSWSAWDAWLLPTGWLFSLETPQHDIGIIMADHPLVCSYGTQVGTLSESTAISKRCGKWSGKQAWHLPLWISVSWHKMTGLNQ